MIKIRRGKGRGLEGRIQSEKKNLHHVLQLERVQHWELTVWLIEELRIKKENTENPRIGDSWNPP